MMSNSNPRHSEHPDQAPQPPAGEQPQRRQLRLGCDATAAGAARCFVSSIAGIPDERAADVALLVSELVSNAVRHGPGGSTSIAVRVAVAGSWARVEVEDSGRGFEASTDDPSGTGLRLVDLLSDRWGIADEGRTFVWFELGRTSG